jgi:two-component system nitrogen regulation response regulator NtrX
MPGKVLVLEDDLTLSRTISSVLSNKQFDVKTTNTSDSFLKIYDSFHPDVALLDVILKGSLLNGIDVLKILKTEKNTNTKVIVLSGEANPEQIDEIRQLGAYHFIEKGLGFNLNQLILHVENAIQLKLQEETNLNLQIENISIKKHLIHSFPFVGDSQAIRDVRSQIVRLAKADEDMFVIGETGTGKEVAVNFYYLNSKRFGKAFHTVNCSALTETLIESELFGHKKGSFTSADRNKMGFFERCDNGILFLDEITNLSIAAQSKILRAIENKEIQVVGGELKNVDARLLFASNSTLEKLSQPEIFRKDLFYRIEGNIIELLPLRERGDDIILLMSYFFSSYAQQYQNTAYYDLTNIRDMLLSYSWPGNVRELKNFCKFILINEKEINNQVILRNLELKVHKYNGVPETAFHNYIRMDKLKDGISNFEKDFLHYHLNKHNWQISHTARQIGIERTTLYKKMKSYKLSSEKNP